MREFKMGEKVRFMDDSATTRQGRPIKVSGIVNGPVMRHDDGTAFAVPVWAERDNGREPTTIFVNPANVLLQ